MIIEDTAELSIQKPNILAAEGRLRRGSHVLEQERIHFWLHAWLLLHVPLTIALLVLGVLHVATALYFSG